MVRGCYPQTFTVGQTGPGLVANLTTNALQVTNADGSTLNNVRIANAVVSTDAVTKAQLDASVANISTNAYNITLGSGGDGDFSSPVVLLHWMQIRQLLKQLMD